MSDLHNCECLSFGDALFLYLEREGMPLHVASVAVFEGVIPLELCLEFIESKLPSIPRYRQRVVAPPFNIGLPSWEYDPKFDIRNHVREVMLKRGTEAELKTLASRILSTNMDRSRPLWDFTLVRGLKGDRTGLVSRVHHSLADGISGVGLMNAVMDTSPTPAPWAGNKQRYQPPSPRDPASLLVDSLVNSFFSTVQRVLTVHSEIINVAQHVMASTKPAEEEATSLETGSPILPELGRLLPELAAATERLPFNVVCHGPQKFNWAEIPLADIKEIKHASGATMNDVALAIVTAAVRRYAELHRVRIKGRLLRIVVPVSLRGKGKVSDLGNRITFLPLTIPLDIRSPQKLLAAVRERMGFLKNSRVAELVGLAGTLLGTVPAPIQAFVGPIASQLPISVCNLICTNVPGPKVPLYLLGHKMLSCYPYVPIGGEMGMNCAILTYNGTAFFGFTGDVNAIPDLDLLDELLAESFAAMRKAFGVRSPRLKRTRQKPKVATASARAQPAGEEPRAPQPIEIPVRIAPQPEAAEATPPKVFQAAAGE